MAADPKQFNYQGAKDAGYSDEDIIKNLRPEFEYGAAVKAGYTDADILENLGVTITQEDVSVTTPPATAAPPLEAPVAEAGLQPELPGAEAGQGFLKQAATAFKERTLEPAIEFFKTPFDPAATGARMTQYLVSNSFNENLEELGDVDAAFNKTVRDNTADLALVALDAISIARAGPITSAIRSAVARGGIKNPLALATLATSIEGGGFLGTYMGLDAAIQGKAVQEVAEETAKGLGIGLAAGGVLGAGIVRPLEKVSARMTKRVTAAKAEAEVTGKAQADIQQRTAQTTAVREEVAKNPALSPDQADTVARKVVEDGMDMDAAIKESIDTEVKIPKNMNNFSDPPSAASLEVKPIEKATILQNPDLGVPEVITNAKTGSPIEINASRAVGRTNFSEIYAEGITEPIFGKGEYSAISPKFAAAFGPDVKDTTVRLQNPFVLEDDIQLKSVIQQMGVTQDIKNLSPKELQNIMQYAAKTIEAQGFDGIIVNVPFADLNVHGQSVKQLANFFSGTTVFKFPSARAATPPIRATRTPTVAARPPVEPISVEEIDEVILPAFEAAMRDGNKLNFDAVKLELRDRTVPFFGSRKAKVAARADRIAGLTFRQRLKQSKQVFASFFEADPGVEGSDARAMLSNLRRVKAAASANAMLDVDEQVLALSGASNKEIGKQKAWLSDYMYELSKQSELLSAKAKQQRRVAAAQAEGGAEELIAAMAQEPDPTGPGGLTPKMLEEALGALDAKLKGDPQTKLDILSMHQGARNFLDQLHDDAVSRGWRPKGQKRDNYLQAIHIFEHGEMLLRKGAGKSTAGKELAEVMVRDQTDAYTKTNIVELLQRTAAAHYEAAADEDFFKELIRGRWNLTHIFEERGLAVAGQRLPREVTAIVPPMNAGKDFMEEGVEGALSAIVEMSPKYIPGSIIVPKEVAASIKRTYPEMLKGFNKGAFRVVNGYLRLLTVGNPANYRLNLKNDFFTALAGIPGQPMRLRAFLQAVPRAYRSAAKAAFKGEFDPLVRRGMRAGGAQSTFIGSLGAETAPARIRAAGETRPVSKLQRLGQNIVRLRSTTELAPRLARGLAEEKGGVGFERGVIEASLPFGVDDPAVLRELPLMRIVAGFWRFQGLATNRVLQMSKTKGSRARGLTGIIAPQVGMAAWNLQSADSRDAEYSLPLAQRFAPHLWLVDPQSGKVLRNPAGRPMKWTFRELMPLEIMQFWGLGNLAGRAVDVVSGRTTPLEVGEETLSEAKQSISQLPVAVTAGQQALTGESRFGRDLAFWENMLNLVPALNQTYRTIQIGINEGPAQAAIQSPLISDIRVSGYGLGDTDAEASALEYGEIRQAESDYNRAELRKDKIGMRRAERRIEQLNKKLDRKHAGRERVEELLDR